MPNRLIHESSPYLLQHANNPVDWYPWGRDALQRAKREDKPVFLSVGYSACHWCHVMEHESFENEGIAAKLNAHFVCIKVDREERPDLDQIYMHAVQIMTGRGGWPMSMFLTPDLEPFYGGTYWPPQPRQGMPGFAQILDAVADAWRNRREEALTHARDMTEHLRQVSLPAGSGEELRLPLLTGAAVQLEQAFDNTHGGFGSAPKFPHSMDLQLLLRIWRRTRREGLVEMVRLSLDRMARGGIYDQLGGGFARYSVDDRWLVPHFEKMLYDNALLAGAYLDGYLVTGDQSLARVARETLDYVLRDMTDKEGGFYSSEDADSEGEEGKFYVWSRDEILAALGTEAGERFCYVYDVTPHGNFEGHNILNLPKTIAQCAAVRQWNIDELTAELAESRRKLLAIRAQRVPPGKDDKVLTSWNALMIDPLARAAGVFEEPRYLAAATKAADFLLTKLRRADGRLLHSWRSGRAKFDAYLDDYTYLINSLVTLYEASFDERWIDEAIGLAQIVLEHFADANGGGFFFTADDHETLIARNKDWYDSSVPSGNSSVAVGFLRLGALTGRNDYHQAAESLLKTAAPLMQRSPSASAQQLFALDLYLGPLPEIVIRGGARPADDETAIRELRRRYLPNSVVAYRPAANRKTESPALGNLFTGRDASTADGPTVYVCQRNTCQNPVSGATDIIRLWNELHATKN